MHSVRRVVSMIVVLTALVLMASAVDAQVYRYKDENGVWHFTDSPPDLQDIEPEQISAGAEPSASGEDRAASGGDRDLIKQLIANVPPKNKVEEARNATVSIEAALGSGSGFFISESGYVITCKHVITGAGIDLDQTRQDLDTADQNLQKDEDLLEQGEFWLEREQRWLQQAQKELEEIDRKVKAGEIRLNAADQSYYNAYVSEYNTRLTEFQRRLIEHQQAKLKYEQLQTKLKEERDKFDEMSARQAFERGFQITLADKTVLNAEQIALSESHDLALLKVEGYKTPYIPQGDADALAQGEALYAIGNPIRLDHSVTSGVFSGRREGLLQTNAQINPGNSGGPLINEGGQVIGINTLKIGGQNIEGIGFAIPIKVAVEEFSDYLP